MFFLQANHRKFVYHVVQGSVKKVEKMLEIGIDPNFITEDGSKSHSTAVADLEEFFGFRGILLFEELPILICNTVHNNHFV